jgi:hypothetical protein
MARVVFALSVAVLSLGCGDLLDVLGGDQPECQRNRDCDDGQECRRGRCRAERDTDEPVGEGEGETDPPPDPEGPRYLEFSTNVTTLFEPVTTLLLRRQIHSRSPDRAMRQQTRSDADDVAVIRR